MKEIENYILILNAGSSSIKCAVYAVGDPQTAHLGITIQGIGLEEIELHVHDGAASLSKKLTTPITHEIALTSVLQIIKERISGTLTAVGYRVVHGGTLFEEPTQISTRVLEQIHTLIPLAPEHLPTQLMIMEKMLGLFPTALHIACFDTAFHFNMPRVAQLTTLPREYENAGLRRYGFHGLSYEYLRDTLAIIEGRPMPQGNVIFAHLGNGASLAAVRDGQPVDTSMGLTPASGVMMSTRSGDIDPGIAVFLQNQAGVTIDKFNTMVNEKSGLLGVSAISGDMHELIRLAPTDTRAKEAVDLFCYEVKKYIGAYAAILGGITTLVFSGGIGEHAPLIREQICSGLGFLGISLEPENNNAQAPIISSRDSTVTVRVIETNEEKSIARHVNKFI